MSCTGRRPSPVARTTALASWHETARPDEGALEGGAGARRRRGPGPPRRPRRRRPSPPRRGPGRRGRCRPGACRGRRASRRPATARAVWAAAAAGGGASPDSSSSRRSRLPNSKRSKTVAQGLHALGAELERRDVVELELDRGVGADERQVARLARVVGVLGQGLARAWASARRRGRGSRRGCRTSGGAGRRPSPRPRGRPGRLSLGSPTIPRKSTISSGPMP